MIQSLGGEAWGHSVTLLLGDLSGKVDVADGVLDAGRRLDKHYLPARYPNGFDRGAPPDFYTEPEAEAAVRDATGILEFCRSALG